MDIKKRCIPPGVHPLLCFVRCHLRRFRISTQVLSLFFIKRRANSLDDSPAVPLCTLLSMSVSVRVGVCIKRRCFCNEWKKRWSKTGLRHKRLIKGETFFLSQIQSYLNEGVIFNLSLLNICIYLHMYGTDLSEVTIYLNIWTPFAVTCGISQGPWWMGGARRRTMNVIFPAIGPVWAVLPMAPSLPTAALPRP